MGALGDALFLAALIPCIWRSQCSLRFNLSMATYPEKALPPAEDVSEFIAADLLGGAGGGPAAAKNLGIRGWIYEGAVI